MALLSDWAQLVGRAHQLSDRAFKAEAFGLARTICREARRKLDLVIPALRQDGYQFASPERVHRPPAVDPVSWIEDLSAKGIHVPVFLHAWLAEVGTVDLRGSDPSWSVSAYAGMGRSPEDVWYTDPLVVDLDYEYVLSEHETWQGASVVDGALETGPFQLPIAPDYIHKANISGGLPYAVHCAAPALDALLLNARDCTSVSYHVTHALDWGGFPGFAHLQVSLPANVVRLRSLTQGSGRADA